MKLLFTILSILLVFNFSSCKKDQTCTCTTSTSATADGEAFPLYEPTSKTNSYDKKMKDKDADEWCTSFEDSSSTPASRGGFNFVIFEKTDCSL